jgi:hypothetical protein
VRSTRQCLASTSSRISGREMIGAGSKRRSRVPASQEEIMIRKLKSGSYRLYSRKKNPKTGKRRNLGTFKNRAAAKKHEKAVQFFKRS